MRVPAIADKREAARAGGVALLGGEIGQPAFEAVEQLGFPIRLTETAGVVQVQLDLGTDPLALADDLLARAYGRERAL